MIVLLTIQLIETIKTMIESRRLSKELEEARERLEKILMERIEEMNEEEEEIEVL